MLRKRTEKRVSEVKQQGYFVLKWGLLFLNHYNVFEMFLITGPKNYQKTL